MRSEGTSFPLLFPPFMKPLIRKYCMCQLLFPTVHRLKEELIRDLVKNSRAAKQLNEAYLSKIQKLERVNYLRFFSVYCCM